MLIVDAHEDLAYNVLGDGRRYLESAYNTRAAEAGGPVPALNGLCMLGLPEWLQAGVAVIFATITTIPHTHAKPGELSYPSVEASYQQALAQLHIYRRWAATHPQIALITHRSHLADILRSWEGLHEPARTPDRRQIGLVLLMENADSIRSVEEVGFWYAQGVRLIGPAWHTNRYTGSTLDPGPLTALGRDLLAMMQRYGIMLDLSHMAEEACMEALDHYEGPIVATHANPRRLVPMPRLLSDTVIRRVAARDGVIGVMPLNWALDPAWRLKAKEDMHIETVVDAIEIVCQLAGDAWHVGLGTDFDGGQGAADAPAELDTIADLPRLVEALTCRGYADEAVTAIMGDNWLRVLRRALPDLCVGTP